MTTMQTTVPAPTVTEPPAPPLDQPDTRRVSRIHATARTREEALALLSTALAPYGSIDAEVPALMLEWVSGAERGYAVQPAMRPAIGHRLLDLIRGAVTEDSFCTQCSELRLGDCTAGVKTPTSGAVIDIRAYAGGWTITVDFGPLGSLSRSDTILESGPGWEIDLWTHPDAAASVRW